VKKLPVFKGFTVDVRLKQFRRVKNDSIEFITFDSERGRILVEEYLDSLNRHSRKFKEFIHFF